ncbi:hypothetical protein ACWD3I_24035 [Streptomyces sp. NPDC002817]|uniref:hypothetical protein n=1 Tax=Streptomyces sp. NPDC088357 TaxID=3154655 RepID=UPI0034301557
MSTRLAPTAACIGTFVLLTHLTMAGGALSHRTVLPLAGLSRIQQVIGGMAPAPAVALPGVCGQAARRGVAAP